MTHSPASITQLHSSCAIAGTRPISRGPSFLGARRCGCSLIVANLGFSQEVRLRFSIFIATVTFLANSAGDHSSDPTRPISRGPAFFETVFESRFVPMGDLETELADRRGFSQEVRSSVAIALATWAANSAGVHSSDPTRPISRGPAFLPTVLEPRLLLDLLEVADMRGASHDVRSSSCIFFFTRSANSAGVHSSLPSRPTSRGPAFLVTRDVRLLPDFPVPAMVAEARGASHDVRSSSCIFFFTSSANSAGVHSSLPSRPMSRGPAFLATRDERLLPDFPVPAMVAEARGFSQDDRSSRFMASATSFANSAGVHSSEPTRPMSLGPAFRTDLRPVDLLLLPDLLLFTDKRGLSQDVRSVTSSTSG